MNRFLTAISGSYFALIAQLCLQLWLFPRLIDELGARGAGIYLSLFFSLSLIGLSVGWVAAPAANLIARAEGKGDADEARRIFFGVRHLFLALGVLVCGVLWGVSPSIVSMGFSEDSLPFQVQLVDSLRLGGIYFLLVWVFAADVVWLQARLQQGAVSLLRLLGTATVWISLLVMETSWTMEEVLLCQVGGSAASLVVGRVYLYSLGLRSSLQEWIPNVQSMRKVTQRVGPGFAAMSVVQSSAASLDALVLGAITGAKTITEVTIVLKVGDVAALLVERCFDVLIPFIARLDAFGKKASIVSLYLFVSRLLVSSVIVGAVLYALYGRIIVGWWVGEEHLPAGRWIFIVAGIVLCARIINRWEISMEIGHTAVDGLAARQAMELGVRIFLFLFLVPVYGIMGALYAMAVSQVMALLLFYRRRVHARLLLSVPEYVRAVLLPGVVVGGGSSWFVYLYSHNVHGRYESFSDLLSVLLPSLALSAFLLVVGMALSERLWRSVSTFYAFRAALRDAATTGALTARE